MGANEVARNAPAKKPAPPSKLKAGFVAASRRIGRAMRTILPTAAGTLLIAFGVFLAWQSWLVYNEQTGIEAADRVRDSVISSLEGYLSKNVQSVRGVLEQPAVLDALGQGGEGGGQAAAAAVKQALPEVIGVEFYTASLNEILAGDLARFGYAKAQMLMQAQAHASAAPVQMRFEKETNRRLLVYAVPVRRDKEIVAFAIVYMPFEPIILQFRKASASGVRLDLRQGDGRGDLQIASIGDGGGSSIGDLGKPIGGSALRIGKAEPEYFIVGPHRLGVLVPLSLLSLIVGVMALWWRRVGTERAKMVLRLSAKPAPEELTLTEALKQAAATPGPSQPKAAAASRTSKPKDAVEAPVNIDRSIFRAYDIRGVVGETLTPAIARLIGRAVGSEGRERGLKEIVIGRDGRLSGPDMVASLIEGLRSTGMDVIDIGAVPTPIVYFGGFHLNTGSGVSVTGSHNPPDYNGFKIVLGGETLSEDAIQALYGRIAENRFVDGKGGLQSIDISGDYIRRIADDIQVERKLKVVVDCGNGIPGAVAPRVLEAIGCEVIPLYCDVDGTFPNHHPDPSDLHNLQDLILSVKQVGADIGLAFDGDGDRLGVVTKTGEVIFPDRLLMLFAIDILQRNPGATIIYDVKCTGHLQPLILQHGGSPLMWRTGHSLIKAKMKETDAALAGEMSGHFFFGERWYGFDDGIYAAARLLDIIASDIDGRDAQQIFDTLPKGVSTPELKIPMREGEHYRFIENFRKKATFDGARVTTIDGIRADWPDGWGLVRASNTTPMLVLRFDADSATALRRVQEVFRKELLSLDSSLPLPF